MPESMPNLLKLSRSTFESLTQMDHQLIRALRSDNVLASRVDRLQTTPGVGSILSLTWALEIGDVTRFKTVKSAVSYSGLWGDEQSSAGKTQRAGLLSRKVIKMQTVLLVDDDEILRRMLHNYLERCGSNLLEAPDGDEALIAEFFEGTIEFLVTDLVMPGIGGLELAGALRQLRPAMRCIFISGYSARPQRQESWITSRSCCASRFT